VKVAFVYIFEAAEDDGDGHCHWHRDGDGQREAKALHHDAARVFGCNVTNVGSQRLNQQHPHRRVRPCLHQHHIHPQRRFA